MWYQRGTLWIELHVCVLIRNRLWRGEGELKSLDPEAGRARRRRNTGEENDVRYEEEVNFQITFYKMADRIKNMFSRLEKLESAGENVPEG